MSGRSPTGPPVAAARLEPGTVIDEPLVPLPDRGRVFRAGRRVRLADADTRMWAAWEERILKALWRSIALYDRRLAPWLDAYFRRAA